MDKNFTPIKGRIIQFIESQKIGKENFYRITSISSSNFKGKGAFSEIGGEKIVSILTHFPELSSDWLILGRGEMLRGKEDVKIQTKPEFEKVIVELRKALEDKDEIIRTQQDLIRDLRNITEHYRGMSERGRKTAG